jgi:hypothetical protein
MKATTSAAKRRVKATTTSAATERRMETTSLASKASSIRRWGNCN